MESIQDVREFCAWQPVPLEFAGIRRNSFPVSRCVRNVEKYMEHYDMRFEEQTGLLEDSLTKFRRLTLLAIGRWEARPHTEARLWILDVLGCEKNRSNGTSSRRLSSVCPIDVIPVIFI